MKVRSTLAELDMQDAYDRDAYAANKALFETLLNQTLAMAPGTKRLENHKALLEAYNNMTDSCMRQVQVRRRLENERV